MLQVCFNKLTYLLFYLLTYLRCCPAFSVDSQMRVRVTDAALSRDLFPADYDQDGGQHGGDGESRPTRWMALESLVDSRLSSASDMVTLNCSLC